MGFLWTKFLERPDPIFRSALEAVVLGEHCQGRRGVVGWGPTQCFFFSCCVCIQCFPVLKSSFHSFH